MPGGDRGTLTNWPSVKLAKLKTKLRCNRRFVYAAVLNRTQLYLFSLFFFFSLLLHISLGVVFKFNEILRARVSDAIKFIYAALRVK